MKPRRAVRPLIAQTFAAAFFSFACLACWVFVCGPAAAAVVKGVVVDDKTGQTAAARLYVQSDSGQWHFPRQERRDALTYKREFRANPKAFEQFSSLRALPFEITLPPGGYTITVERGKEYRPLVQRIDVGETPRDITLPLHRWANMAERGWYSGDTHVHRTPLELPDVILSEDVNVVLPIVYWTTVDAIAPSQSKQTIKGDFPASPVQVDTDHVYYPRNTEYEIFTASGKSHMLGALLVVNHRTPFDLTAMPLRRVAERARAEGALLDLEKHNWPWSMAIVPIVRPDLFELANNHHWRTEFSTVNWAVPAPAWMDAGHGRNTERDWALYGFRTYYALLDSGFRLAPTAATGHGVHPVPLGFSRVYVHLEHGFDFDAWMAGLKAGHSFITTGPMLMTTVDGQGPGSTRTLDNSRPRRVEVAGTVLSEAPLSAIEIIVNGEIARTVKPRALQNGDGAMETTFSETIELTGSSWIATRCWELRAGNRIRFAHTAPSYFDQPDRPLRPKKEEIDYLIQRTRDEIARSETMISPEALAEYRDALREYEQIAKDAR